MPTNVSWLVYNGGLYTEKFKDYERLITEAASRRGLDMHPVANDELLVQLSETGTIDRESRLPEPDFIHFADKDIFLAEALEAAGMRLFNCSKTIALCDDKRSMHRAFAAKGIRQPRTYMAPMAYSGVGREDLNYVERVQSLLGFPLIIKEAFGSFGEQVYWIESREKLFETAARLQGTPHLYQEVITDSIGKDVRINVIGGKAVAAMKRTSAADFRANVTAGGAAEPYRASAAQLQTALQAARAVGADFAGVDLFLNNGEPIVCEVNSNPHVRSIIECTGTHVENDMIEHMMQRGSRL
jgi:RimK family alpha-L-glutamate ligase